jgi:hypothetical protein
MLARYGVVRSGRVASGPASKATRKRAENSRSRNERRACRLSAGEYATMHPQCSKGPRPGVVPGTRAFDGGGVEVICTGRVKGEARLVAGQRDLSRARCTLLQQHDNLAAGQLQGYVALLVRLRLLRCFLVSRSLRPTWYPPIAGR